MRRKKINQNLTHYITTVFLFVILLLLMLPLFTLSQENTSSKPDSGSILTAARELMKEARYCALITVDESGQPQARTMDPFPPENNVVVWFGTNRNSGKVREIKNNSRVTLYYQASNGAGYVTIKGRAALVDDVDLKSEYWKDEWQQFYPDNRENYLLIRFVPENLEIVSYKHNLTGDTVTWEAPSIILKELK